MRSTVTEIDPKDGLEVPPSPRPGESITASATRITKRQIQRSARGMTSSEWQADAWDMYDLVGEQHFLANTLAGRMGQAKFYVGRLPEKDTEEIEEVTSGDAYEVFQALDVNGVTSSQKIVKMALNLFMAGDCYLLGAPPESEEAAEPEDYAVGITPDLSPGEVDLDSLEWSVHSSDEIAFDSSAGKVKVERGAGLESAEYDPDEVFLIRIWRAHPRWAHQADSATRACLPILRELVGLTMQISAQVDSRLAGAGLFLIPESADRAARSRANLADEDPSPFATALMDAMITPISDRSSASAVVPLTVVVPDDSVEKFKHLQFSTPLDSESRSLRDEAIRRLALSQDCPPEILLGVGGMNHWGAWLVREDVVVTHLEPPLALICDALTSQFLWPVLEQMGVADAREYVIWYDVSHMILRPDRSGNAKDLHAVGAISDTSLRRSMGFDESDAPEELDKVDPAIQMVMSMVASAPSLAQDPGLPALLEQVRSMLNDESPAPAPQQGAPGSPAGESGDATDGGEDNGPPATDSGDSAGAEPPALTASVPSNPAAVAMLKGLRSISRSVTEDEGDSDDDA